MSKAAIPDIDPLNEYYQRLTVLLQKFLDTKPKVIDKTSVEVQTEDVRLSIA